MGTISLTLPSDGSTAEVSDYNTPINTIKDEFNGNIDNDNIKANAGIAGSKLADSAVTTAKIADANVTPVKWTNPYKFSAYATTYTAPSAIHTVQINTKDFDSNSNFNTSTYTYTAPVAGFYFFSAGAQSGVNAGTGYVITIRKNGTDVIRGNSYIASVANSSFSSTTASGLVQLAANDAITVVWTGAAGTGNYTITGGSGNTFLQGFLVSQT